MKKRFLHLTLFAGLAITAARGIADGVELPGPGDLPKADNPPALPGNDASPKADNLAPPGNTEPAKADEAVLPGRGYDVARYETLWTKSPFSVATAAAAPDSPDYTLVGFSRDEGVTSVSLIDKQSNEHFLVSTDKPAKGLTLVSVNRGQGPDGTTVVLQRNGQMITLKLDTSAQLAGGPPAGAPGLNTMLPPGQSPPGMMPGQVNPYAVTPPPPPGMPPAYARRLRQMHVPPRPPPPQFQMQPGRENQPPPQPPLPP